MPFLTQNSWIEIEAQGRPVDCLRSVWLSGRLGPSWKTGQGFSDFSNLTWHSSSFWHWIWIVISHSFNIQVQVLTLTNGSICQRIAWFRRWCLQAAEWLFDEPASLWLSFVCQKLFDFTSIRGSFMIHGPCEGALWCPIYSLNDNWMTSCIISITCILHRILESQSSHVGADDFTISQRIIFPSAVSRLSAVQISAGWSWVLLGSHCHFLERWSCYPK